MQSESSKSEPNALGVAVVRVMTQGSAAEVTKVIDQEDTPASLQDVARRTIQLALAKDRQYVTFGQVGQQARHSGVSYIGLLAEIRGQNIEVRSVSKKRSKPLEVNESVSAAEVPAPLPVVTEAVPASPSLDDYLVHLARHEVCFALEKDGKGKAISEIHDGVLRECARYTLPAVEKAWEIELALYLARKEAAAPATESRLPADGVPQIVPPRRSTENATDDEAVAPLAQPSYAPGECKTLAEFLQAVRSGAIVLPQSTAKNEDSTPENVSPRMHVDDAGSSDVQKVQLSLALAGLHSSERTPEELIRATCDVLQNDGADMNRIKRSAYHVLRAYGYEEWEEGVWGHVCDTREQIKPGTSFKLSPNNVPIGFSYARSGLPLNIVSSETE